MGKKQWITKLMDRDRQAFTALSKTGHCSKDQLNTFIKDGRIKNMVKDGYLQKVTFSPKTGDKMEAYKLTAKGRDLCTREWGVRGHYIAQSLPHDLALANKYFSLTEAQRDTWKTESQLRAELENKLEQYRIGQDNRYYQYQEQLQEHKISVPDCTYVTSTGTEIAYEVITNSYGQAEIQAKIEYVQIMELKMET